MTPAELYDALDRAGARYEIVEIFEGVRVISVVVDDEDNEDDEQTDMVSDSSLTTGEES
jgi:hypothetical protein